MRSYDAPTLAALQNRGQVVARLLVWVTAQNRISGLPEEGGIWSGAQDQTFTIDGTPRLYVGGGGLVSIDTLTTEVGLAVRIQRLALSSMAPEVVALIREYEARLAPVEIHRALFDPASDTLIAEPHRVFRGWIDEAPEEIGTLEGEGKASLSLASASRALTKGLALKRSDESQRLRGDDRFRRYSDVSGSVPVYWGEAG